MFASRSDASSGVVHQSQRLGHVLETMKQGSEEGGSRIPGFPAGFTEASNPPPPPVTPGNVAVRPCLDEGEENIPCIPPSQLLFGKGLLWHQEAPASGRAQLHAGESLQCGPRWLCQGSQVTGAQMLLLILCTQEDDGNVPGTLH